MTEISEKEVRAVADVLLGRVNAPEQEIYRAARDALSAAARVRAEADAGEPVAWLDRLRTYGEPFHDGRNQGTLFKFKDGSRFFLADADAHPAPQPSWTIDPKQELADVEASLDDAIRYLVDLAGAKPSQWSPHSAKIHIDHARMSARRLAEAISAPQPSGKVKALVRQIDALLALNKTGNVSHPIPGLAVELLKRSKEALSALTAGKPEPSGTVEALADALRGLLKAYENAFDWTAELPPETAEAERIANEVLEALTSPTPPTAGGGE